MEPSKGNRMTIIILWYPPGRPGMSHLMHLSVNLILSPYKSKVGWGGKKKINDSKICEAPDVYSITNVLNFQLLVDMDVSAFHKKRDQRLNSFALNPGFSIDHWELPLRKIIPTLKEVHYCSLVCTSWDTISVYLSSFFWTFIPMGQLIYSTNLSKLFKNTCSLKCHI